LWEWPAKSGYSKGVKRAQSGQWKPYATERENHSVKEERKLTSQMKTKASYEMV
jgi:hypothetical protein